MPKNFSGFMTAGFDGEIQEKYRIKDSVTGREQKLPLYHKGVDEYVQDARRIS